MHLAQFDLDYLLTNWARWLRSGRGASASCFSIEGRYRRKSRADDTPTGWGDWLVTPPGHVPPPIDELAALEVERTMRHLPRRQRKAIVLYWVFRMPERMICRRLALRYVDWTGFLAAATCMIGNLLTRRQFARTFAANSHLPSKDETHAPDGALCVSGS